MLVVMKDRYVQPLLETALHLKAPGSGNILQVYPAEGTGDKLHSAHQLVHVLGAYADREGVNSCKGLKQRAFSLHNGHSRLGPDIPEAQHCRAVGDNCHQVSPAGIGEGFLRVLLYLKARRGYPGGICHRKVVPAV